MDDQLIRFLIESKEKGYASQDESFWKKEKDESTSIEFESGDWSFHDNYFGGEPYGGRQVVFYRGKPIWMNVYYGQVDKEVQNLKEIYAFLKKALLFPREKFPLRGKDNFTEGDYKYRSSLKGNISNFTVQEKIYYRGRKIYGAVFYGGYVDRRKEN
ncbi:MAG: DUF5680 domain-containing protein [Candidatus Curtissbacteria bacterium]|nr:DUF5680 domain-containing protein [Candidatus Curtissbacteria bacterium]